MLYNLGKSPDKISIFYKSLSIFIFLVHRKNAGCESCLTNPRKKPNNFLAIHTSLFFRDIHAIDLWYKIYSFKEKVM